MDTEWKRSNLPVTQYDNWTIQNALNSAKITVVIQNCSAIRQFVTFSSNWVSCIKTSYTKTKIKSGLILINHLQANMLWFWFTNSPWEENRKLIKYETKCSNHSNMVLLFGHNPPSIFSEAYLYVYVYTYVYAWPILMLIDIRAWLLCDDIVIVKLCQVLATTSMHYKTHTTYKTSMPIWLGI